MPYQAFIKYVLNKELEKENKNSIFHEISRTLLCSVKQPKIYILTHQMQYKILYKLIELIKTFKIFKTINIIRTIKTIRTFKTIKIFLSEICRSGFSREQCYVLKYGSRRL